MSKTYYVVVTGAGGEAEGNPSPGVRDALPDEISLPNNSVIKVFKYPFERLLSYRQIRSSTQECWSGQTKFYKPNSTLPDVDKLPNIDLMLHIGKSDDGYAFETTGAKSVYKEMDDEGELFPEAQLGPGGIWEFTPEILETGFIIAKAVEEVNEKHPDVKIRNSDDAGQYFCELELYSSLAVCWERGDFLRAEFIHIPVEQDETSIMKGAAITHDLILSLIQQL